MPGPVASYDTTPARTRHELDPDVSLPCQAQWPPLNPSRHRHETDLNGKRQGHPSFTIHNIPCTWLIRKRGLPSRDSTTSALHVRPEILSTHHLCYLPAGSSPLPRRNPWLWYCATNTSSHLRHPGTVPICEALPVAGVSEIQASLHYPFLRRTCHRFPDSSSSTSHVCKNTAPKLRTVPVPCTNMLQDTRTCDVRFP